MKSPLIWLWCGATLLGGCSAWNPLSVRSQSPDTHEPPSAKTRLVRDLAVPFGMFPVRVEAVGLVTGLHGTGSDPAPSPQRAVLLDEMQTRGVKNPNAVMSSNDTSLVLIRGVLRPGIQKGDHFDVEVRVPSQSETTSIRGGYLLEARLKELAVLNNQFHEGHVLGHAQGAVMVDPAAAGTNDRVLQCRGEIPGGGVCLKSRPLGLVLKPGHQTVFNASRVANAVNKRFHTFQKGVKSGVAKAETDKYIELTVHPRYKDNIERYVDVVRAVAMQESDSERTARLADLKARLIEPTTAADAALQLEAIGTDGVEPLLTGVKASDAEVRFYAAEALAYLDRREATEALGEAARTQPAFRVFALTALGSMDDFTAHEQLRGLLEVASAETRYGAFRALSAMNSRDPLVLGESLGGKFSYHVLGTSGPPMVHVTRNRRAEVVLFGQNQHFTAPLAVSAGNEIMVNSCGPDEVAVSKFEPGKPDEKRTVSTRVDDVIRAIVDLGGTYPDVVQALQEAKKTAALASRFEVEALPTAGRSYDRLADAEGLRGESADRAAPATSAAAESHGKGFLARIMGRAPE